MPKHDELPRSRTAEQVYRERARRRLFMWAVLWLVLATVGVISTIMAVR